jgi:hypothetical protein
MAWRGTRHAHRTGCSFGNFIIGDYLGESGPAWRCIDEDQQRKGGPLPDAWLLENLDV